tara:strand:+ start:343 stop:852 length:510 start_codon:yes stop_codon:yes gene_type:complete
MTFQNLLRKVKYKPVFNIIYKQYYLSAGYSNDEMMKIDYAYSNVFDNLLYKEQNKTSDNLQISLKSAQDEDGGDPYIDAHLYDSDADESFGLDFCEWGDILAYEVNNSLNLSDAEIVAHVLWEITFWGFTEAEVQNQKNITLRSIEDIDSGKYEAIDLADLINELNELR